MAHHELKTMREYFEATMCGDKTFEVRQNDRHFVANDTVTLREFNDGKFTGSNRELSLLRSTKEKYQNHRKEGRAYQKKRALKCHILPGREC